MSEVGFQKPSRHRWAGARRCRQAGAAVLAPLHFACLPLASPSPEPAPTHPQGAGGSGKAYRMRYLVKGVLAPSPPSCEDRAPYDLRSQRKVYRMNEYHCSRRVLWSTVTELDLVELLVKITERTELLANVTSMLTQPTSD